MKKKYLYLHLLLLGIPFCAFAQENNPFGNLSLDDTEFVIEKDKKIELLPASRLYNQMEKKSNLPLQDIKQVFDFQSFHYELPPSALQIQAQKLKPTSTHPEAENGFLKAGIGNYLSSYTEAFYGSKEDEKFRYAVYLRHNASARGPVQRSSSAAAEQILSVAGNYFLENLALGAQATYRRNALRFYGFDPEFQAPTSDSLRQRYQHVELMFDVKNAKAGNLQYKLQTGIAHSASRFQTKQFTFLVEGQTDLKLFEELSLGVDMKLWASTFSHQDSLLQNRNLFLLNPYFKYAKDKLGFRVGTKIYYNADTTEIYSQTLVYPELKASYHLNTHLSAFLNAEGGIQTQNLQTISDLNPYLADTFMLRHTKKPLEVLIGLDGHAWENLRFSVGTGFAMYKELSLFARNPIDTLKFYTFFDSATTTALRFQLSLEAKINKVRTGLLLNYNGYKLGNYQAAFGLPTLEGQLHLNVPIGEKFFAGLDAHFMSGIRFWDFTTQTATPNTTFVDLSIRGDYLVTEQIGVYLKAANLVGGSYQRWENYPVKRYLLLIGGSYHF